MTGRRALLCLGLTLLGGCRQGPDFAPPAAPGDSGYAAEPTAAVDGAPLLRPGEVIDPAWWRMFDAPVLNGLVDQALAGSPALAAATARVSAALALVDAQAGTTAPQVGLNAVSGRQKYGVALFGPSNFHIPPFNYTEAGPTISSTLDLWGGEARALERQQALAAWQAQQLAAARLSLAGDVVLQAIGIASLRGQIDTAQAIIGDDARTLALIREGQQAGAFSQTDLESAAAQAAADRTLLPPLQQQLAVARHALSLLLGQAPSAAVPPELALAQFALPATLPLTLPSDLVHRRPDIVAAEAQLHAATAAVGVATADLYPHITLSASATLESLAPQNLFELGNAGGSLLGSVSQTLFDGGTLKARQQAAQAALAEQQALYRQTVLVAFGEVADSLRALDNDAALWAAEREALDSAERSLALARQSLAAGQNGLLPLLDAERLQHQAALAMVRAQAQRLSDCVALVVRSGGGVVER